MPVSQPTVEQDIAEVKRIHDEWWASNADFDIARMRACFASGDKFLQYNLNGHTYRSVDELTKLWELIGRNYGIPELEIIDIRIEVRGDSAGRHGVGFPRGPHPPRCEARRTIAGGRTAIHDVQSARDRSPAARRR